MSSYLFVDSRLQDRGSLLVSLPSDIEVYILDPEQNGLAQIAHVLAGVTDLAAIHIMSHGAAGTLYLGNTWVNSDTLGSYSSELSCIGTALSETGDILLYGCDVARGVSGQSFIEKFSLYTGADIAASTNTTGSTQFDADWVLEASSGLIETDVAISQLSQERYGFTLSTAVVSTAAAQVASQTQSLTYELVWTRADNGGASCTLYDNGSAVLSSADLNSDGKAKYGPFAWDDAIPWASGVYMASLKTTNWHSSNAPAWQISPDPANRTNILLHYGNYPDNSHGCLVAPKKFLKDLENLVDNNAFRLKVVNDFPLAISLDATATNAREGSVVELKVKLSQPVTKDIWVKVDLDDKIVGPGFATAEDVQLLNDNLRDLSIETNYDTNKQFEGYYVDIKEGSTEAVVKFKIKLDSINEPFEQARFKITGYAVSDDTPYTTNNNVRFYADRNLVNIDRAHDFKIINLSDSQLPLHESGGSGHYPFSVAVSNGDILTYSFDAYSIPDALRITDGTQVIVSTGIISGSRSGSFTIQPDTTGEIEIVVDGNSDSYTAWDLGIDKTNSGSSGISLSPEPSEPARTDSNIIIPMALVTSDFPSSGNIDVADSTQIFSADLAANRTYLVTIASTDLDFDPTLEIRDAGGAVLATLDNRLGGVDPFAFLTTSTAGNIDLVVGGAHQSTGGYQISLDDVTGQAMTVVHVTSNVEVLVETAPTTGIDESGTGLEISVFRDGDITTGQTFSWRIVPEAGSGASAADLAGVTDSGILTYLPGEFVKGLSLSAFMDGIDEGSENFRFEIISADGAILPSISGVNLMSSVEWSVIDTFEVAMLKTGTVGPDNIIGGGLSDTLSGSLGDDTIQAYDGNDSLDGGPGRDTLIGGVGNDFLKGSDDEDALFGDGAPCLGFGTGSFLKNAGAGNFSIEQAIDISNLFTVDANPDIVDDTVIPHVSVSGVGDGAIDFYRLNIGSSATQITLDIDYGDGDPPPLGFDSYLRLLDVHGRVLSSNDDSSTAFGAGGSTSYRDSFLIYNTTVAGTYYIAVGSFPGASIIPAAATYVLQVSVAGEESLSIGIGPANSGNDTLDGGAGSDTLAGGDGSDAYFVRDAGDVVSETNAVLATGGTDTVLSTLAAYTLTANVENGRILATTAANLTGNTLNNILYAGAGNNVLDGGSGLDTVSYAHGLAGTTGVTVSLAVGTAQATGGSGSDTLISIENLIGSAYADNLTGNADANSLGGGAGSDTLDGGTGSDTLVGGDGSDAYFVSDGGDVVSETNATASTGGRDTVFSTLAAYTLTANVENGRILATTAANLTGNTLNNVLYAGAGNNVLDGGSGLDTVSYAYGLAGTTGVTVSLAVGTAQATGGSGSDTLISIENLIGSASADKLTGNTSANNLAGESGNDTLDGGAGNDTLVGGDGSDAYFVSDGGDVVSETNATASTGGTDTVFSTLAAYTLTANVENGRILATTAANLTGNTLNNVLYAGAGNNVLDGGSGLDTVSYAHGLAGTTGVTVSLAVGTAQATGGSGSDTLISIENLIGSASADKLTGNTSANNLAGGSGNDTLDGGAGNDTLVGGDGSDAYFVSDGGDVVSETNATASTGGTDTVFSALAAYTLPANVENGRILATTAANLTGNTLNNVLYAGAGNNVLDGGSGLDTVSYAHGLAGTTGVTVSLAVGTAQATGGSGSDTLISIENLIGSASADKLTGNTSANNLAGGSGNDTLDGGAGNDTLVGGDGSDAYFVSDGGDVVSETNATASTGGTDTVFSTLAAYTLTANVENGRILATTAANLTGNTLNNVLYASAGNNVLNGGSGIDTVSYAYGLAGTSGVTVSLAVGTAQATGGSGSDTLTSIENLFGSAYADSLTGNTGANSLNGGSGNDLLSGGLGNDILIGGLGSDIVRFDTLFNATSNRDTISDFNVTDDTIQLENAIFTSLATLGMLAAGSFRSGVGFTSAADANDYLIYNSTTGALYYDADGSGAGVAAVQFATLGGALALSNLDFVVT